MSSGKTMPSLPLEPDFLKEQMKNNIYQLGYSMEQATYVFKNNYFARQYDSIFLLWTGC